VIEIHQKHDRALLEEHAHSSFHLTWLGRNEWLVALLCALSGILMVLLLGEDSRWLGIGLSTLGIIELIRNPSREQRWVKKKLREKIVGKEMAFRLSDDSLTIAYDKEERTHAYAAMRGCWVSSTGVLFKITYAEYYYISFNSLPKGLTPDELIKSLATYLGSKLVVKRPKGNYSTVKNSI